MQVEFGLQQAIRHWEQRIQLEIRDLNVNLFGMLFSCFERPSAVGLVQ